MSTEKKDPFFITTPIFYVNDVPHIGHAYTSIAADVVARFMRLAGREVFFLTGTDEHGQKVENSALKYGISPQEFTDKNSAIFREMMEFLNISNDDFIRTTEERHKRAVVNFWEKLLKSGAIYLGQYSGWYSVRDEAFYSEQELTADGKAPTGAPVEWVQEPSYFFALSKWQDALLDFYDKNPDFIRPQSRRNEVISFVKSGLNDLSVSRTSFKWGIKVPKDEDHVIYVWLDALTNYISALGYPELGGNYEALWSNSHHILGKDILRFHAVYWPAFLLAAGMRPPKSVIAHGWWTNEGEKISKSLGNVIDPFALVRDFGLDNVRYFLIKEVPFGNDGNFARENLIARCNSELSNKIGNLLQRSLSFLYKNCNARLGDIPQERIDELYSEELLQAAVGLYDANYSLIENFEINKVVDNIIAIAEMANGYIDRNAPWGLKTSNPIRMNEILYILLEASRYIAIILQPFTPSAAAKMLDQLGIGQDERSFACLNREFALKPGSVIAEPTPVFPRVD